jgi:integrase
MLRIFHTYTAALAHEGVPVNVIQARLGHSSLATTRRYLAHVQTRCRVGRGGRRVTSGRPAAAGRGRRRLALP